MEKQLYETEKKGITDTDRVRLGAELAGVDRELIDLKEQKADVARVYRVKIKKLEEEADTLSRQLADGVVEHRFEVVETADDARQMVEITRKDTGQRINTRPMNEAEKAASAKRRQGELFDGDDDERHDTERPPPPPRNGKRGRPARRNGKRS